MVPALMKNQGLSMPTAEQRSAETGERCKDNPNKEVSYLLSAAVVNRKFAQLLLADPALAVQTGYHGRSFRFSPEEIRSISTIHASTLREFASALIGLFANSEIEKQAVI